MHWRKQAVPRNARAEDLFIPAGDLAYYGHWITAPGRSRRFDTRFFVALRARRASKARTTRPRRCTTSGSRRAKRSSAPARGEIELVIPTQAVAQGPRAVSPIRAPRSSTRAPCRRSTRTAPAGRRATKARRSVPPRRSAVLRDPLERSRGDRRDHLRPRRRRAQAARPLRDAPHRAQPRA